MTTRFNLPGTFPIDDEIPSAPANTTYSTVSSTATELIESQQNFQFNNNQLIHNKRKYQFDILTQIDALVYIIIFYQFVKFCHSACLIPMVLHLVLQILLNSKIVTQNSQVPNLLSFLSNEDNQDTRERIYETFIHKYCYLLYIKTILVILYHTLFVATWVMYLVDTQQLQKLNHGTWWFISFIGEETPVIDKSTPYWLKLFELGLFQLIFTDVLILFLQLALYQCIYKQSDAFHLDRRLNEKEVYIIRTNADSTSGIDDQSVVTDADGVPTVLKIRLFECFKSDAYAY